MTNHMFTHLVPLGSPIALRFFIVFIETVSNIIRPITLSVRLAANIIAGHLLLSLLRGLSEAIPSLFLPSSIVLAALLTLEYAVALIQSYVFITLMSLYLREINWFKIMSKMWKPSWYYQKISYYDVQKVLP